MDFIARRQLAVAFLHPSFSSVRMRSAKHKVNALLTTGHSEDPAATKAVEASVN
jgi:hypothetical protein